MAAVECGGVGLLVQGMAILGLGCIRAYTRREPGVLRDPGNRGSQRMGGVSADLMAERGVGGMDGVGGWAKGWRVCSKSWL